MGAANIGVAPLNDSSPNLTPNFLYNEPCIYHAITKNNRPTKPILQSHTFISHLLSFTQLLNKV